MNVDDVNNESEEYGSEKYFRVSAWVVHSHSTANGTEVTLYSLCLLLYSFLEVFQYLQQP